MEGITQRPLGLGTIDFIGNVKCLFFQVNKCTFSIFSSPFHCAKELIRAGSNGGVQCGVLVNDSADSTPNKLKS